MHARPAAPSPCARPRATAPSLLLTGLLAAGCSLESPTDTMADPVANAHAVQDLEVSSVTGATITLRWTQVDDGTGEPARYVVKHGGAPLDWKEAASVGCEHVGDQIGAEASCIVEGLSSQPYVFNAYYGTSFPTPRSPRPGKNVGWTDWTHAR